MLPVLVIGGGVFGASFAYELTARGRSVVLAEGAEFAAGTSANSMKTIHGGIRHLARLDIAQVVDSIKARAHVAALFPDLLRPVRFVAPAMSVIEYPITHRMAAIVYNVLCRLFDDTDLVNRGPAGMVRPVHHPELFQHLTVPLAASALTWTDLQVVESELLVLRLLRGAEQSGADIRDHSKVAHLEPLRVCYRATIQATGSGVSYVEDFSDVFDCSGAARVAERCLDLTDPEVEFVTACNLVLHGNQCEQAIGVPLSGSRNLLFTVPWRSRTIVGTWYFGDDHAQHGSEELLHICLGDAHSFLVRQPTAEDIAGFHSGKLPAARSKRPASPQARLLRRCQLLRLHNNSRESRLFVVRGTKYTNAPRFAKRIADRLYGPPEHAYPALRAK